MGNASASPKEVFIATKAMFNPHLWRQRKKLAVVLGTTLDNLAGLEDGIVIRLPNLSEAEEAALREFIRRFIS